MSMSAQLVRHKHLVSTMLEISGPDSIVYQEDWDSYWTPSINAQRRFCEMV